MGVEVAAAALAVNVLSQGVGMYNQKQAAEEQKKGQQAQANMAIEKNRRAARQAREQARIQQAAIQQAAANTGGAGGSGAIGSVAALQTNMAGAVGEQSRQAVGAQAVTDINQRAAGYGNKAAAAAGVGKISSMFLQGEGLEQAVGFYKDIF